MKLALVTLMQGCAQAAASGLLVEYTRRDARYGRTQVAVSVASTSGFIASQLLIGFGMNAYEFNGTFATGLSFGAVVGIMCAVAALMVPAQLLCNRDEGEHDGPGPRGTRLGRSLRARRQCYGCAAQLRAMLSSRAALCFLLWVFIVEAALPNVISPAVGLSQEIWAGVQVLPRAAASVLTAPIYILGLLAYERHGLGWSYQRAFVALTALTVVIDAAFKYPNVLGLIRNQYFTLGEDFALKFPTAALGVVESMASIALAPAGAEALWLGIVDLAAAAGYPLGRGVGNAVFARFVPSLSNSANFVADTPEFRTTVAFSYLLGHAATALGVTTVCMIPDQKADALRRLREWPRHWAYAVTVGALLVVGLWFGTGVCFLQLSELDVHTNASAAEW